MSGQRCGMRSRVSIFFSSWKMNFVACSIESVPMCVHISSTSLSAVRVISTRYFAATLELAEECAHRTRLTSADILFGGRQQSCGITGAKMLLEGSCVHQNGICLPVYGENDRPSSLSNLIQYLSGFAL